MIRGKLYKSWSRRKERGVVLLTALVFMLILLAMLRFTLTSARVQEQKAAMDFDIVTARQSAQAALNFAEQYILGQGRLYCEHTLNLAASECNDNRAKYAGDLFGLPVADLGTITHAGEGPAINTVINNGIYTGAFISANAGCQPFWACINWPVDAHAVRNSATQMNLAANVSLSAIECATCIVDAYANIRP